MADYDSSLPIRTKAAGDVDVFISDNTTPSQKLKVNADGSIDANASQGTHDNLNANANIQVGDTDVSNGNPVPMSDAGGSITVDQSTHDNFNVNANLQIGDADVDATNPVPVVMTEDQAGDEIVSYNTSASVASDASVNHDYTVSVGKTLLCDQAWVSGSGKLKVELQVNAVTKFVGFNSTSNPNVEIPLKKILKGAATEVVRMIITNRDNQPQDVYSTLTGLEV